ncbi:MAG: DNA-binding response regulator [Bacteroidetes bacterium]|nr:MAG: DNA-binding response regulator [Bacteroidota bacterium]
MTLLIIEDENVAKKQLINYLTNIDSTIDIVGQLSSIADCERWFAEHPQPDIIFSDIELLDGNIFTFLDKHEITSPIVFTTAYDQYLLKAFDTIGVAYLLKPFTEEQIKKALDKCVLLKSENKKSYSEDILSSVKAALKDISQNSYKQRLTIKLPSGLYLLPTSNISLIKADAVLLNAYDFLGKKFPLTGTLSQIEQQLSPAVFYRINRSELININAIEKIENQTSDRLSVYLKGQKESFIVSTAKTPNFRSWIDK